MGTNCKRATRPCKCGYLGHPNGKCRCTPDQVALYRSRISGPLLDRIDLHVEVPALSVEEIDDASRGEGSDEVRERIVRAHARQLARQGKANARLSGAETERYAQPDPRGRTLLSEACVRLLLSARAHHRVLKVARTIADLAGRERVGATDLYEALRYRSL